jgi:hypothetical protein
MGAPSTPKTPGKRFGINPVEIAVFSLTVLAFSYSVFNLLSFPNTPSILLSAQAADPKYAPGTPLATLASNDLRSPASVNNHPILNIEVGCQASQNPQPEVQPDSQTTAGKVRLNGALCDIPKLDSSSVLKTQIVNNSNRYLATVFTDLNSGKFSTDYIPLSNGRNAIHLEFVYSGGKTFSKDFVINKN